MNRRRTVREGVEGSSGASGVVGSGSGEDAGEVRLKPENYEDVTDWNTFGFRYRL